MSRHKYNIISVFPPDFADDFTEEDLYFLEKLRRCDVHIEEAPCKQGKTPRHNVMSKKKREYLEQKFNCRISRQSSGSEAYFRDVDITAKMDVFEDRVLIIKNNCKERRKLFNFMYLIDNSISIVGDNCLIQVLMNYL